MTGTVGVLPNSGLQRLLLIITILVVRFSGRAAGFGATHRLLRLCDTSVRGLPGSEHPHSGGCGLVGDRHDHHRRLRRQVSALLGRSAYMPLNPRYERRIPGSQPLQPGSQSPIPGDERLRAAGMEAPRTARSPLWTLTEP
jgi:hypothetical protein